MLSESASTNRLRRGTLILLLMLDLVAIAIPDDTRIAAFVRRKTMDRIIAIHQTFKRQNAQLTPLPTSRRRCRTTTMLFLPQSLLPGLVFVVCRCQFCHVAVGFSEFSRVEVSQYGRARQFFHPPSITRPTNHLICLLLKPLIHSLQAVINASVTFNQTP